MNTIVLLRNENKWLGSQEKTMKQVPIVFFCEEKVTTEICQSELLQHTQKTETEVAGGYLVFSLPQKAVKFSSQVVSFHSSQLWRLGHNL